MKCRDPIDLNVSTDGHARDCLLFTDPEKGECDCRVTLCGKDTRRGGCNRVGNRPDGRCWQHTADAARRSK